MNNSGAKRMLLYELSIMGSLEFKNYYVFLFLNTCKYKIKLILINKFNNLFSVPLVRPFYSEKIK